MKKIIFILSILFFISSCTKDVDSTKTGAIKAAIQFKIPNSSNYVYSWGQTEVTLLKDWETISTQYTTPDNPTIDLGQYEYGSYQLHVKAPIYRIKISNNQTQTYWRDQTVEFKVDQPTTTVNAKLVY